VSQMPQTALRRPALFALFIALAVALDQVIKLAVERHLPFQELVPVIPMLGLFRTYNQGIAFSLLSGLGDGLLIAIAVFVSIFVLYLWANTDPRRLFAQIGFALIMAGAIGNVIDRILLGHVIDYILIYTQTWSFAVFNLADSFITIGAGFVILDEILEAVRQKSRQSARQKGDDHDAHTDD